MGVSALKSGGAMAPPPSSAAYVYADVCEILTIRSPITPKRAGTSGSKINDDGVLT